MLERWWWRFVGRDTTNVKNHPSGPRGGRGVSPCGGVWREGAWRPSAVGVSMSIKDSGYSVHFGPFATSLSLKAVSH